MKEKKQDKKKYSFFFIFMFSFVYDFFSIGYLAGLFIIDPINNLIFDLFFSAFKCRLDISCNKNKFNQRKNFLIIYFLRPEKKQ